MSPVVLPCHVQGRPQPSVTWTKAGAKLGPRGGSYRVLPTGNIAYSVYVQETVLVMFLSIMSYCNSNTTAQLTYFHPSCTSYDIIFILLCVCTHFFYTGVLELTAALPSHAGRYTCSARNPAGVAHKHISLIVQGGLQATVQILIKKYSIYK